MVVQSPRHNVVMDDVVPYVTTVERTFKETVDALKMITLVPYLDIERWMSDIQDLVVELSRHKEIINNSSVLMYYCKYTNSSTTGAARSLIKDRCMWHFRNRLFEELDSK